MFFSQNGIMFNGNRTDTMDFGVRNALTMKRIITATVALESCLDACTRHISSYVILELGDKLIIDTSTPGVYFKMIRAKTFFGAYMVGGQDHRVSS